MRIRENRELATNAGAEIVTPEASRPPLCSELTGAELRRWYWLKEELVGLARTLGVPTGGGKQVLTARLAAALDGAPFTEPVSKRPAGSMQLSGLLVSSTVIPQGQRCSQVVRAWFTAQVGEQFRFDEPLRAFFAAADGTQTLQDALDHYRATRGRAPGEIGAQFEYNRFTRAWHQANPDGSANECAAAWRAYRGRPVDERGQV